jgi:hypothetical protein
MRSVALLVAVAGCAHPRPRLPPSCPVTAVIASSQASLDALANCDHLAGLTVRSAGPLDLAPLSTLAAVDGDVVIGPTLAVSSVGLPALRTVAGRFAVVSGGGVTGIFVPALETAGAVEIRDNVSLQSLSVPHLRAVTGPLTIARVPTLEFIDLSALVTIGGTATIDAPQVNTWLGVRPSADAPLEHPAGSDEP